MGFAREISLSHINADRQMFIVMELSGEINVTEIERSYEGSLYEYWKLFAENIKQIWKGFNIDLCCKWGM